MRPLYCLILVLLTLTSHGQIITTIAGQGPPPYIAFSGDGGPAVNAHLGDMYHTSVAFDAAGNIYISQAGNNRIRKVDAAGIITTIAGTGTIGYSGDGGPALNATLYHPGSIIVDNAGNIILADQNSGVLRKIDAAGIITTISAPYAGACSGEGVQLSQAVFSGVYGLSKDNAGNIYVSDQDCNTVRKISTSGIVTTVAGNGTLGFSGDGGPAISAQLNYPGQVAVDNTGNIYIPDADNNRIRKVNTSGVISTIGGNGIINSSGDGGPASSAEFAYPISICADNVGNIYVAESYGYVVRKIDAAGIVTDYAGNQTYGYSGDGGPANLAQVTEIENIDMDAAGNLYIVDYYNQVIRKVSNCLTATFSLQPAPVHLCNTGNATFTVNTANANNLQWQVNTGAAWVNLSDNGMYAGSATNTLAVTGADLTMNDNQFRCVADNSCGTIYSHPVTLTVVSLAAASVSISTGSSTICSGANTSFQAVPANGGMSPTYQWQKNSIDVGNNSSAYSDPNISDGDIITCLLTSNAACITNSTAPSNSLIISVNPILTASISISASSNNICAGIPVTFTANPVNEGNSPSYQWYRNGSAAGTNSGSYTDNTLHDGDVVSCTLASSYGCLTSPNAPSNTFTMNVAALVSPSIAISTPGTAVCEGSPVVFSALILNGGNAPVYQWQKNGTATGASTPVYTDNDAGTGDLIRCVLTSNGSCLTDPSATSNPISVALSPNPVVHLDQSPGLCVGGKRILDAGKYSSFLWSNGSNAENLTISGPGIYSVTVTDGNGCKGTGSTTISTLLPSPSGFLPPDTAVCTYGSLQLKAETPYDNYLWSDNSSGRSVSISRPGLYWLEVTDNNNCVGRDSVVVAQKDCLEGFFIPNAFTPNSDGKNDYFKPLVLGKIAKYEFAVFNRWGQAVFQSTKPTEGWDGALKGERQLSGTFVWICTYQFAGGPVITKKGTVILVR
jgi:gliding motility-associated-like protein